MSFFIIYLGMICGYILRFIKYITCKEKENSSSNRGISNFVFEVIRGILLLPKRIFLLIRRIVQGIIFIFKRFLQYIIRLFGSIKSRCQKWCQTKKKPVIS